MRYNLTYTWERGAAACTYATRSETGSIQRIMTLSSSRCVAWAEMLQRSGYRLTAPRRAVLCVLDETPNVALDVTHILSKAKAQHPSLGKATVYRTLERMEMLGLVRRVHDTNGCHCYVAVEDAAQSLLVCVECGRVLPTPPEVLTMLNDLLFKQCGYRIVRNELQIVGICPECG